MGTGGCDDAIVVGPHGVVVTYGHGGTGRRRIRERDRHGTELAALTWRDDALAAARLRIPDGSWVALEPGATGGAPWGRSDRVWHRDAPVTVFAAVDYGQVASIPPLADPGRLPPGAGTTVLNLLAALAADQGAGALPYAGPYPTESLFLALLESFRYVTVGADGSDSAPPAPEPLRAFLAGSLAWRPAPHTRLFTGDGVCVQLRDGVEKVTWRGRVYYRPRWQDVVRRTPYRVRDVDDGVVCSLWALERAIEDHLVLSPTGELRDVVVPPPPALDAASVPAAVAAGVVAIVAARSAPALAPVIRESGRALRLEWGPVDHDLFAIDGPRARFSIRIAPIAAALIDAASTPAARAGAALIILAELATLLGDSLRTRAQTSLLSLDADAQAHALAADAIDDAADAPTITRAIEALLAHPLPLEP